MESFQDLVIQGPHEALLALLREAEQHLTDGWRRNWEREHEVSRNAALDLFCFSCDRRARRAAADLWLSFRTPNELRVSNIVPSETAALSYTQYNQILQEFAHLFVFPVAPANVQVLLSQPETDVAQSISPMVQQALKQFTYSANKSTGSVHPSDKRRWEAFVIAAHQAHTDLSPELLARWLIEKERWPEEAAQALANEYEQARALLEEYDKQLENA